jgi:hypothetical protein
MHHSSVTHIDNPGPVKLTATRRNVFVGLITVGLIAFVIGVMTNPARAWHNYLIAYYLFLGFSLFGLFFAALNHAVNATWMIVTRRLAESMTAYLHYVPILAVVLWLGISLGHVYPWTGSEADFAGASKHHWLSQPWFSVRHYLFLFIWYFFAWKLVGFSLKQDASGDIKLSRKMLLWSIVFLPVFAVTFSVTAFDLMMSLQPHWYSTLFAVYCFAGFFQSGLALLTILFILFKRQGALAQAATPSHLKDLGTLVFAFTIFMTYIGFSQYMLIWYANLPEETVFFLNRQQGGWQYLFLALPVFKFAIPFFGLLSQALKKNEKWLLAVCVVVLIGQYLDIYWLVMPALRATFVPIGWMEIGILALFAGVFGLAVSRFYAKYSVLATRDPRILQSVNWRFWE